MQRSESRSVAIVVALLVLAGRARAEPPAVAARDAAELERRIGAILSQHHVPGGSAVVAGRDGVSLVVGLGRADVATGAPATPDTLFRIGSISKVFTALAVLGLVEDGRLRLDAPVRELVPTVAHDNTWEATDPVRVVHLLEHTTGWDDIHLKDYAWSDPRPATLEEALQRAAGSQVSRWRPGTRYAYCNTGPAVAALIVEKLTGERFEDHVRRRFLDPVGMPTAGYLASPRTLGLLSAHYREDGTTPLPYWHFGMRPSGGMSASAREMAAFLRFLLDRGDVGGTRLLTEASLQRMETPTTAWGALGGLSLGYGLGNRSALDDRRFVWHGHDGIVPGGASELAYLPQHGVGYSFSINAAQSDAFDAIREQLRAFATQGLSPGAPPPLAPVAADVVRDFEGWYTPINPRMQSLAFLERLNLVRVSFEGQQLKIRAPGFAGDMVSVDGRRFRKPDEATPRAVLMDSADGRLLVLGTGQVWSRVSPVAAWLKMIGLGLFVVALLSVPGFALIWGPRWLFRRLRGAPRLHVRVLPLLAVASLVAIQVIVGAVGEDYVALLGNRTGWSVALCAATVAFALFSILSLAAALRPRPEGMNRWVRLHSLGVSIMFVVATLYLAWWGMIGYRSWT